MPATGEQTRLSMSTATILGAKGLIYDRQISYPCFPDTFVTAQGNLKTDFFSTVGITSLGNANQYLNNISADSTDWNFLRSPWLEGDFLTHHEHNFIDKYINFATLANYFGVDQNRIYLGRLSQRLEMKKWHMFINVMDSTLMRLKLSAWFGKGYKNWYCQDDSLYGTSNLLSKIIDTSRTNLFTKRIWNPEQNKYQVQRESWDSSFFDITLLRDTANPAMSNQFYISCLNRRTDPLIYCDWDSAGTTKHYLRFLSTADLRLLGNTAMFTSPRRSLITPEKYSLPSFSLCQRSPII